MAVKRACFLLQFIHYTRSLYLARFSSLLDMGGNDRKREQHKYGGRKISRFIFSLFSHFHCIVRERRRHGKREKIINNKVISMLLPLILKFTAMPCCLFIPFKMSHSILGTATLIFNDL